jgi:NAD(P)-dependent dehydrogenase (short-subunit alcohol dehydrogenase family)
VRVLVTGGAKRLGAAIARACAGAGHQVVIHYRSSRDEAEALAGEIGAAGLVAGELAELGGIAALFERAREAGSGPIEGLVNSASTFEFDRPEAIDPALTARLHTGNCVAPAMLAAALARQPELDEGVVVNLLDQKVDRPNPDFLSYTATRMGLAGLTAPLALALAPNIRIAGIAPGLTLPSQVHPDSDFAQAQGSAPLRRGPTPEDLVSALRFILRTPSFTGQVITVDAGESLVGRPRDVAFDQGRYD